MPGSFEFLHIKRHTAGSSNELSFDVLDAARSQLDDTTKKSSRAAKTPSASRGNYRGVAGTSTLSAIPEVERRKKLRRAHAIRIRVIVTLVVVVAFGVLGFAGYSFYQSKVDFSNRYDALVSDLSAIDEELVKVDVVMTDPLAANMYEKRIEAKNKLDWIEQKLDAASDATEKTIPHAMGDKDAVALTQMGNAIEGRKDMLAAAKSAFGSADQFDQELDVSKKAWNKVLNADRTTREATASANNASTDESTESAKRMTQEARDQFAEARADLEGVMYRYESVDLSAQLKYLDKRIEALDCAIATADALIAGDREQATSSNNAYNELDEEAAQLAQELPLLIDDQVRNAFEKEIAPYAKKYNEARGAVSETDADIRAYLSS